MTTEVKNNTEITSKLMILEEKSFKRKLLAICPICNRRIYGRDLKITNQDLSSIKHFPFTVIYCHRKAGAENDDIKHAVALYLDADLKVRSIEPCDMVLNEE